MPQGYTYDPNAPPRSATQRVIDGLELAAFYIKMMAVGGLLLFVVGPMMLVLTIMKHFASRPLKGLA